ncbi:MAG TPA: hypothetical protein VLV83_12090 [Acidobacteriota bacterium]|nr:hypothetical protein [Acidobacteriota bacterium]
MKTQTASTAARSRTLLAPLRSQRWLLAFAAALALCLAAVVVNVITSDFRPSSYWGMGYGVCSTLLLLAAAAYAWRRRAPRRGPGAAHHWLHFHTYGGLLFLLLVLMHTGFRFPNGVLAWVMWVLSIWIVASGLAGLGVQRWIPRLLTSGLGTEANYERIPELVESLRQQADSLAEQADPAIRGLYKSTLRDLMAAPRTRPIFFLDITGGIQSKLRQADHLRGFLDSKDLDDLDRLVELYKTKTDLDAHWTLQKALRWWLYAHVPVSLTLIVLVGFHVFSILYY